MAKASEMKNENSIEMGEAYYCTECKRNHTKGKIYKEHLQFAKIENGGEEITEDDELELNEDDYSEQEGIDLAEEIEDTDLEEDIDLRKMTILILEKKF